MTAGTGAMVRTVLDTGGGLVRRQVEVPAGGRHAGAAGPGGELCFVIEGAGQLSSGTVPGQTGPAGHRRVAAARHQLLAGRRRARAAATGQRAAARVRARPGAGTEPEREPDGTEPDSTGPDGTGGPLLADLAGQPAEITGDRQFRVLFAPGQGCAAATQFVGEIPPGRAPFHRHTYDEVVLILAGEGVLHVGDEDRPLAPGSCLHLAPGTPHCLENTGQTTLRVLGVFHPGGSPAAKKPASG